MTNDVKIGKKVLKKSRHVIPWCAVTKNKIHDSMIQKKEGKNSKILYDDMALYSTSY
jgi:hypothetical protein